VLNAPYGVKKTTAEPAGEARPAKVFSVCLAIPTYNREQVLLDTIRQVLAQEPPADEVLVVDQTVNHAPATARDLTAWHREGRIRWIRRSSPNASSARNQALIEARSDIVIFIDDDVVLGPGFVEAHRRSYDDARVDMVAGQVLSKDGRVHSGRVNNYDMGFPLNHDERTWIGTWRSCNCSVRRRLALELGGFDEQYFHGASKEESDFAARAMAQSGRRVLFEPRASVVHLAEPMGGARSWGGYFAPRAVAWAVGEYYFALMNLPLGRMIRHVVWRLFRNSADRYCRRHPWVIPPMLAREAVGFVWALALSAQGRKLIPSGVARGEEPCYPENVNEF
jgi:GT2 family glycosyltransferase